MSHGTQFTALTCIWRSRLARASAWNIPKNKKKGAPARDGRRSQKKDPGCCQNGLPKSIATKKTSDSANLQSKVFWNAMDALPALPRIPNLSYLINRPSLTKVIRGKCHHETRCISTFWLDKYFGQPLHLASQIWWPDRQAYSEDLGKKKWWKNTQKITGVLDWDHGSIRIHRRMG